MKSALENKQTAQQILSQRQQEPAQLERLHDIIEQEAEAGGLVTTVSVQNGTADSTKSSLEELGYVVSKLSETALLISWDI
jgi:hypothetical protein